MKLRAPFLALIFLFAADAARSQEALSAQELDATRGGLMTPWGGEIGFGAVVRTQVDGELALQSQLTWTPQGPRVTHEAGAPTPNLADAAAAHGLSISADASGVLSPGEGGATVVLHELTARHIGGLVLNTASNRDIRQSTEITLTMPDLPALQQGLAAQALSGRLDEALGLALRDAVQR